MAGETYTNKELLEKIIELNNESIKNTTEMQNEMKHIKETVDTHGNALERLLTLPDKIDSLSVSIEEMKSLQAEQNEKRDEKEQCIEKRLTELENKDGKIAKSVWKQIGSGFLGSLIALIAGLLFGHFGGK